MGSRGSDYRVENVIRKIEDLKVGEQLELSEQNKKSLGYNRLYRYFAGGILKVIDAHGESTTVEKIKEGNKLSSTDRKTLRSIAKKLDNGGYITSDFNKQIREIAKKLGIDSDQSLDAITMDIETITGITI